MELCTRGLVACVSDSFDVFKACRQRRPVLHRTPSTVAWHRSPAREYWGGELKEKIKGRISAALSADSAR